MVGGRDAPGERQQQQQQDGQAQREARRPAMGESWRNQPHVRLVLARGEGGAPHTATLAAHTSALQGPRMRFWLGNRGPMDRPPAAPEL